MKAWRSAVACLGIAGAVHAAADDKELDLIPQGTPAVAHEPAANSNSRVYVEDAFVSTALRDGLLVPFPPPAPPRSEDRLFADARLEWVPGPQAFVAYSGRLNLKLQEDLGFPNRGNVTHDWRELYLSAQPRPREYVDAGRINVKSGVALGFNPTDFFKARAVVDPLTADPRALREDRLGTLMVRGQRVGERVSFSALYAPKVANPDPIAVDPDRGFDPLFGRTNAADKWLAKASARLASDFNPEALLYHDPRGTRVGVNLTQSVGQSTVAYLEWSGGRRSSLYEEALGHVDDVRFRSQVATGASYTTESRITFNLEYHYNGAGLSSSDWDRWFASGPRAWLVRAYAADQQEPLQRHAVFARMDWVDFLVPKLELTGFVLVDARDGSTLAQLEADYARSDQWSFGVLANGTTGGRRSNFGSLPREASVLLRATRYF